jgi:simple sugar transport system ATP-binding protein
MAKSQKAVRMHQITKRFASVVANDRVSFEVNKASIHGIVGENGAGKSTIMKILSGLYQPDEGQIFINDQAVTFHDPKEATSFGIGMVYQHFMLVPTMTVLENMIIGFEPMGRSGSISTQQARDRILTLSKKVGFEIDPDALVADLSVGIQQRVEILKALFRGSEILILDEPTAVLTPQEVDELFQILRKLKENGTTIFLITHKLKEVLEVTDQVTVFQKGKSVGTVDTKETSQKELAQMMVGREVLLKVEHRRKDDTAPVVCEVRALFSDERPHETTVQDISFSIQSGEIFGIAGVEGNGQTPLIEMITGLRACAEGEIFLEGSRIGDEDFMASPRQLRDRGVSHIPEDRLKSAVVESFTIQDNLFFGFHHRKKYGRNWWINQDAIEKNADDLIAEYDIRPPDRKVLVGDLSGGNQQKCVVARELSPGPKFVVAAQPTRGVDIGAIEFIHEQLMKLKQQGSAVLLVSAELDELFSLCDRVGVLFGGRLVKTLKRDEFNEREVGLLMTGGEASLP